MMKLHTRRLAGLVVLLAFCLCLAPAAGAQSSTERVQAFCSAVAERQQAISQAFSVKIDAYEQEIQQRVADRAEKRTQADDERNNARAAADTQRSKAYELLKDKQQGDEARARVDAFAREIELAVQARRGAYDSARAEYQQAIDGQAAARHQSIRDAAQSFRQTAEAVMSSAAQRCSDGEAGLVRIYQDAVTGLRDARLSYADTLRGRQEFRSAVQDAAERRDAAYKSATATFQQAFQAIISKYDSLSQ